MNGNSGSLHMRSSFYSQLCCWQTVWIWALHLSTFCFPLHKTASVFANLSLSRTQHTSARYCHWCHSDGPCAVCTAEYSQAVWGPWFPALVFVPGSACWAVPAGQCLPAPPGAACAQLCAAVTSSLEETASSVTFPCMLSDTYSHSGCGWLQVGCIFRPDYLCVHLCVHMHTRTGSGESLPFHVTHHKIPIPNVTFASCFARPWLKHLLLFLLCWVRRTFTERNGRSH